MIKVISFTICPFVQRVTALLEAKQIDYRVEYISLSDKPDWFLAISPLGQVPVLVTEQGDALFDSDAIVEYLEEAYPVLLPERSLVEKARDRALSTLASKHYLSQCSAQRSANKEILQERKAKLNKAFATMEQQLGDGQFYAGDKIGLVDLAWLVLLHRAAIVERASGFDFLAGFIKLKAWQTSLLATGLAERSVSEQFDEAFSSFYLAENSWLGQQSAALNPLNSASQSSCTSSHCC